VPHQHDCGGPRELAAVPASSPSGPGGGADGPGDAQRDCPVGHGRNEVGHGNRCDQRAVATDPDRLAEIGGPSQGLDTSLGFSPADADRLLRALRIFIDEGKRGISEASLGSANVLYLALKLLEIEHLVEEGARDHTFLAIEEPEAHLHPYLQRLVYRDVLRRRAHQEGKQMEVTDGRRTILLTTHSPHVVSVSPLESLVALRKVDNTTEAASAAELAFDESDRDDLERYLDVSRAEMLFAKGVLLVEGDAETYLVPALARLMDKDLDQLGIAVCSVSGTRFGPYVKLLKGLNAPLAVLTDRDPSDQGDRGVVKVLQLLRDTVQAKILAKYPTERSSSNWQLSGESS